MKYQSQGEQVKSTACSQERKLQPIHAVLIIQEFLKPTYNTFNRFSHAMVPLKNQTNNMHAEHRQCTYQHPLIRGRKPKFYRPQLERDKDQIHYNTTSDQTEVVFCCLLFLKQYN